MATCETVTVEYPGSPGPVVINKEDYDPDVHKLVGGEVEAPAETETPKKRGRPRKQAEEVTDANS